MHCMLLFHLILVYVTFQQFSFDFRLNGSWVQFFFCYFLVMSSMFSIGLMIGGIGTLTLKIAGVAASILYFPMLIFSGQQSKEINGK